MINAAVAAALGTVAGAAQAVNLGADGQGQVLIYPFYTVQQKGSTAFDTYISIVNSDSVNGKAVKVRFVEAKNSVEVLDFNLYLSPNDMWTAGVTRDAAGNAVMQTNDNSCTVPEIPTFPGGGSSTAPGVLRQVSFTNVGYSADAVKDGSLARAREGYLEIIQMADIVPTGVTTDGLNTFNASLHGASGVPSNCAAIRNAWSPPGPTSDYNTPFNDGVYPPTGGLMGAGTIINTNEGTASSYDAVALDRFSANGLHFEPGSIQPQLTDVNPKSSSVFWGNNLWITNWGLVPAPQNMPVSAVLMRNQIVNVYAVEAGGTSFRTDWVVTMPTKRQHTNPIAIAPFTSAIGTAGACETVTTIPYDREEQTTTTPLGFSPPTPGGVFQLCWEANVISMNTSSIISNVLGGQNTHINLTLPVLTTFPAIPAADGWLRMGFGQTRVAPLGATTRVDIETAAVTPGLTTTYTGLPVVGFAAISASQGSIAANYGSFYGHAYYRNIQP
jgi:hypothetical protein